MVAAMALGMVVLGMPAALVRDPVGLLVVEHVAMLPSMLAGMLLRAGEHAGGHVRPVAHREATA